MWLRNTWDEKHRRAVGRFNGEEACTRPEGNFCKGVSSLPPESLELRLADSFRGVLKENRRLPRRNQP